MNENISLLEAVVSTMDTIPIVGIDAQDKFVGCANAIRNVISSLRETQRKEEKKEEMATPISEEEVTDGR